MKLIKLLACIVWVTCNYSSGLRDVRLEVPQAAQRGARVEMKCHFKLENELLYTVKWYRGEREFCRYSPRDVPPLKIFDIPGIPVVKSESDAHRLTIAKATSVAQGRYSCEVSAEAPSFQTSVVHAHMHVVDLPAEGPELCGFKDDYRVGMKLKVECVLRDSQPAANLTFYINGAPASSKHVWHRVEVGANKLMSAFSTIQFVVQRHDFKNDRLKLRCIATIYSAYYRGLERTALDEDPPTSTAAATTTARLKKNKYWYDLDPPSTTTTTNSARKSPGSTKRFVFSSLVITNSMLLLHIIIIVNPFAWNL